MSHSFIKLGRLIPTSCTIFSSKTKVSTPVRVVVLGDPERLRTRSFVPPSGGIMSLTEQRSDPF